MQRKSGIRFIGISFMLASARGFYALSDYFYLNDIKYHSMLHRCWQLPPPFDLTPFVAFGMEGFVMELRSIGSFIKMKLNRVVDRETLLAAHSKAGPRKLRASERPAWR